MKIDLYNIILDYRLNSYTLEIREDDKSFPINLNKLGNLLGLINFKELCEKYNSDKWHYTIYSEQKINLENLAKELLRIYELKKSSN